MMVGKTEGSCCIMQQNKITELLFATLSLRELNPVISNLAVKGGFVDAEVAGRSTEIVLVPSERPGNGQYFHFAEGHGLAAGKGGIRLLKLNG